MQQISIIYVQSQSDSCSEGVWAKAMLFILISNLIIQYLIETNN